MKRLGIYVPDEAYEKLRLEAFNSYTSISKLIVGKLTGSPPSKFSGSVRGVPKVDSTGPISRVVGKTGDMGDEVSLMNEFHPQPK